MIASLPMYDRPETAAANDRYWNAIRDALRDLGQDAPENLTRRGDLMDQWFSPDLIFSQTCGYPYRARLHGHVQLVATPVFDLPDCPAGYYYSVFVTRPELQDRPLTYFADQPFAYNEPLSQSGWAAPAQMALRAGFAFSNTIQSGGHANSADMVRRGDTDLAALDVLTWSMIRRLPIAKGLTVIAKTPTTPALPYICAKHRDPAPLRAALKTAIAELSQADQKTLGLRGLTVIAPQDYLDVPTPPPPPA